MRGRGGRPSRLLAPLLLLERRRLGEVGGVSIVFRAALGHDVHLVENLPGADHPEGDQSRTVGRSRHVTLRNRCHALTLSTVAASSTSVGQVLQGRDEHEHEGACGAPDDLQHDRGDSATDGPLSQSHSDRLITRVPARAAGGLSVFHSPSPPPRRCSSPRGSENHVGPSTPNEAEELVEGPGPGEEVEEEQADRHRHDRGEVERGPEERRAPLRNRWLTMTARPEGQHGLERAPRR